MLEILRDAPTPQQTGAPASPATIARRLKVAQAMQAAGMDYSPVQSWTQGAARVAQALVGAWKERQADTEEKAGQKSAADAFATLFGGAGAAGPQATVAGASGGTSAPASTGGRVTQAVNSSLSPNQRALLDTIAGTESPDYNTMYGGKKFDSYAAHPGVAVPISSGPNAGRTSSAAGRYQFLGSTWNSQAQKLGLKDFSPENQDLAAWDLAATTYKAKTGRDLTADLNDPNQAGGIGQALSGVWTSLPGGIEAGTNHSRFADAYAANLGHYGSGAVATAPQAAPAPVQVASADPNFVPAAAGAGPQASVPLPPPRPDIPAHPPAQGSTPFTPAAQLKQGNFQPGSLTPAQAKQYADSGYNVPNTAINWGQEGAAAAPAAAPQPGTPVVAQAMQNAPQPAPQAAAAPSPVQAVAGAARGAPSVQQLIAASQNPWLSEGQRSVVSALLSQALKPQEYGFQSLPDGTILRTDPRTGTVAPIYNAPVKPMEVNGRLVNPNTGQVIADYSNPQTVTVGNSVIDPRTGKVIFQNAPNQEFKELNGRLIAVDPRSGGARDVTPDGIPSGYRPATDAERAQFGVAPGVPLYFGPDGKPASLGPQTSVSIQGGESQFDKTVGEGQGKMFLGLAEDGPQAKADLGNIQQLRGAIATLPGGFLGGAQAIANQYGIKLGENAGNLEYANAILSKLTPAQRQGMPGAASDRDVQMFRDALPKLSNTPEGNKLILDTMEALANQRLEQARIATLVTTNQMNRQDGMKALQALPDPFAGLKAAIGPREAPKQGGIVPAAPQATQAAPGAPKPGTVEGGYRFKGGDPSNPNSWEKVQ